MARSGVPLFNLSQDDGHLPLNATDQDRKRASPEGRWAAVLDGLDETEREALSTEVDRALSGRIRDLELKGRLRRLYLDTSWRHRSRVSRAWLTWSTVLSLPMMLLDVMYLPSLVHPAFLMRLVVLPFAYLALIWVWARPRGDWIEGSTLPLAVGVMMIAGGVLGFAGGDQTTFRYLTAALLASSTAIVIFPVTLFWTVSAVAATIAGYTAFGLFDPMFSTKDTIAFAMFFTLVLAALIPARRTINILQQHGFVLNLRGALQKRTLASVNARLAVLANTDALTSLPNRRAFAEESARLWAEASKPPRALGILLFDIDHFKKLNDSAGHATGDRCLAAIADAIRAVVSDGGLYARYGGEEFICIVSDATPLAILRLAEALRAAIEALAWPNPGVGRPVTISVGLALGITDGRPEGLTALIGAADEALYRAKARGRNRVAAAWEILPDAVPGQLLALDQRRA